MQPSIDSSEGSAPSLDVGGDSIRHPRAAAIFVRVLGGWVLLTTALVTLVTWKSRTMHAVLMMSWGLIFLWIICGGLLMYCWRDQIRRTVTRSPLPWYLNFVLFCTLLALIEEAITTTMTNLAPLFGVKIGEAYITASTNYLDVVCLHSVVMFVPLFVGWAFILKRFRFSAFSVFLLFGMTGTLMETKLGTRNPLEFGFWIFIYGLMVYLPAYCVPMQRSARPAIWWHYPVAVVFPFLFIFLVPIAIIPALFFPHHPELHFPPIAP